MEENKQKIKGPSAPTVTIELTEYEKLRADNMRLRQQLDGILNEMDRMHDALVEKRLSFLFRVVENSLKFDDAFVDYCKSEIVIALTPIEKEQEKKQDGE